MAKLKNCSKALTLFEHTCYDGMNGDEYVIHCEQVPGHLGPHAVAFTSSYDGFSEGWDGLDSWNPSRVTITWEKP